MKLYYTTTSSETPSNRGIMGHPRGTEAKLPQPWDLSDNVHSCNPRSRTQRFAEDEVLLEKAKEADSSNIAYDVHKLKTSSEY